MNHAANSELGLTLQIFCFLGKRVEEILSYDYLDSYAPANISLDILQPVKRWLRNPLKNRGLSIQLRSSLGVDQPLEEYLQIPTDCLSERGQSGKILFSLFGSANINNVSLYIGLLCKSLSRSVVLCCQQRSVFPRFIG